MFRFETWYFHLKMTKGLQTAVILSGRNVAKVQLAVVSHSYNLVIFSVLFLFLWQQQRLGEERKAGRDIGKLNWLKKKKNPWLGLGIMGGDNSSSVIKKKKKINCRFWICIFGRYMLLIILKVVLQVVCSEVLIGSRGKGKAFLSLALHLKLVHIW